MAGSAADAISQAVERSKQLLFPLKGEKWFALGFTVFLAQCGEGGGVQVPNFPGSGGSSFPSTPTRGGSAATEIQQMLEGAWRTLQSDLTLYVALAFGGLLVSVGLWLCVLWFSSRAKLMFVESVIWDRVDVGGQWTRAAELGLSLFKFRAAVGVAGSLLVLLAIGGGFAAGFPDFLAGHFLGSRAVIAYVVLSSSLIFLAFPLAIALQLLDDFVVPLMVIRNARVRDAWRMFRAEVLSGNVGGLVLFYLLRFVLAIAIGIAAVVLTCVTCCLVAIPYLGTVILLPISVFSRAYPLYFMEQLGVAVFPPPEPSWVAYDQWRFPR